MHAFAHLALPLPVAFLAPVASSGYCYSGRNHLTPYVASDRAAEVDRWLGALSSDTAADRALAERSLAAIVTWDDWAALRRAALGGDAEVRTRISEVLAEDERRLELAARFAAEDERTLAELGRRALGELVSRWSTGLRTHGQREADLASDLEGEFEIPLALDGRESLATAVDELARFGGDTPPVVIDPRWTMPRRPRREVSELSGTFDRLLATVARLHGAALEGFGFEHETAARPSRARAWILVTAPDLAGTTLAHAHWIDWCAAVAKPKPGLAAASCARALAECEWPAALAWLEARWLAFADANALEGLVAAADRGRTVRTLATVATERELLARMSQAVAIGDEAGDARASEIARALASTGATAEGGEDLGAPLAELVSGASGATRASGASGSPAATGATGNAMRWLALVALEGHERASDATVARVRSVVEDPDARAVRPLLRLQALRALAAIARADSGGRGSRLGDAQGAFEWARTAGASDELLDLLARVGAAPPKDWLEPAGLPAAWDHELRVRAFDWWFASGDEATAARHVVALAKRGEVRELEVLAARLDARTRRGERARVESVLRRASAEGLVGSAAFEDLAILAGFGGVLVPREALERRVAEPATSRRDLLCAAALAASDDFGPRARAVVVAGLTRAIPIDDRIAAADRALSELRRARAGVDERGFVSAVRAAVRDADQELVTRLRVDLWPAPVRPEVVVVRRADRLLDRASL